MHQRARTILEVASLAEEQTREVDDPDLENKEVEHTAEKRKKSEEPPVSQEIRPTKAVPRSHSLLRLPSAEPVSFSPC